MIEVRNKLQVREVWMPEAVDSLESNNPLGELVKQTMGGGTTNVMFATYPSSCSSFMFKRVALIPRYFTRACAREP